MGSLAVAEVPRVNNLKVEMSGDFCKLNVHLAESFFFISCGRLHDSHVNVMSMFTSLRDVGGGVAGARGKQEKSLK